MGSQSQGEKLRVEQFPTKHSEANVHFGETGSLTRAYNKLKWQRLCFSRIGFIVLSMSGEVRH